MGGREQELSWDAPSGWSLSTLSQPFSTSPGACPPEPSSTSRERVRRGCRWPRRTRPDVCVI